MKEKAESMEMGGEKKGVMAGAMGGGMGAGKSSTSILHRIPLFQNIVAKYAWICSFCRQSRVDKETQVVDDTEGMGMGMVTKRRGRVRGL